MIDASAMVEALIGRHADTELLGGLAGEVSAPHLLDVEVLSALRGLLLGGRLESDRADQARRDYFGLTISRYDLEPMAERVWELRHLYTSYDACYLAAAEALGGALFSCDAKLDSGGHHAEVRVLPRTH